MNTTPEHRESEDVVDSARALENATQHLCRATLSRPRLTPADVDVILAHLAATAAALPQAAQQLSDILDEARHGGALDLDTSTDIEDPDLAIHIARLHLDATSEPAVTLYRHLDAAHQQTARITTAGDESYLEVEAPRVPTTSRRTEDHATPRTRTNERGQGVPR